MIVRNKIVLVLGRPGEGKTFLATFLSSFYPRIYSNFEIQQDGKVISKFIKNVSYVTNIPFSEEKGVVVLDEGGININARSSQSGENREFGELAMLSRKKNVDIIVCAQLGRMVDVYFRELANYTFEMHAWFERRDYLMFEAKIYGAGGESIVKVARFDLFQWSDITGISYNTLDESRIAKNSPTSPAIPPPGKKEKNAKVEDYVPIFTDEWSPMMTLSSNMT